MPKLSIVIPTKNRYETLIPVIKSFLKHIQGNDFELVVHDNSDNNSVFLNFLKENPDPRIRYIYTDAVLTQSGNSNAALACAAGDYIIFIGDDDLVSPYIMEAVYKMEEEGIDCLAYSIGVYYWNDVIVSKKNRLRKPGLLVVPGITCCRFLEKSTQEELQKVLNYGGVSIMQLTRLYHGIVSRKLLDCLYRKCGTYAVGSCPDMNIAVMLSSLTTRYSFVNYPLSLSGVSKKSAAGMDARNSHRANLETMVESGFLPGKVLDGWNPFLPKVWTIPTIYAQALYEALQFNRSEKEINYSRFYAVCFCREFWAKNYIIKALRQARKSHKVTYQKVLFYYMSINARKFLGGLVKGLIGRWMKKPQEKCMENIETVDQCMEELKKLPFDLSIQK